MIGQREHWHILHTMPDLQLGGGQILLYRNIVEMRSDERFAHSVFAFGGGAMADQFRAAGIPTVIADVARIGRMAALFRLIRFLRDRRVDLVHTNNTLLDRTIGQFGALAGRLPVVNTFHAALVPPVAIPGAVRAGSSERPRQIRRIRARLARELHGLLFRMNTRGFIAVSRVARDTYSRQYRLPSQRMAVISPGLPAGAFTRSRGIDIRAPLGIRAAEPLILCIGRLELAKGQRVLIPTMELVLQRFPDAVLLLAGDGEDRALLERTISDRGLHRSIKLLGNRTDVPDLLHGCDIVVNPSLAEGFGLVLLEAMAAGKPTVALDLPSYRDFAGDGETCTLVASPDPALLAAAVERLAADRELAGRYGDAALIQAKDFTAARTAACTLEVYCDVLHRNGTALDTNRFPASSLPQSYS
jgi:glycosyltransferase involved in cell wall biosynthesis